MSDFIRFISNVATSAIETFATNEALVTGITVGVTGYILYNNITTKVEEEATKEIVDEEASTKEEAEATTFGLQGCLFKNIKLCNTDRARAGDEPPFFFRCDAECVIDYKDMFHVIPVVRATGEALEDWMKSMFRLEGKPDETQIVYSKRLNKEQCMTHMMDYLNRLRRCKIMSVPFPYLDQEGNDMGGRKERPCVVLYGAEGDDDVAELYFAVFIGQDKHKYSGEFELEPKLVHNLTLGEHGHLVPTKFQHTDGTMRPNPKPHNILDCTKLTGLPYYHSYSGTPLAVPYLIGGGKGVDRSIEANYLKAVDSEGLRTKIVDSLKTALLSGPITDYEDTTMKYDIGKYVEYYRVRKTDGEIMSCSVRINGPPGYSSLDDEFVVGHSS